MKLIDIVNTEEGKYLLGTLGGKPTSEIVKVTKNSFIEHLEGRSFRATFFSKNPIERLFQPIIDKVSIANDYKRVNFREAFLHYSGLKQKLYKFPQIYLTTSTFNPASGANSPVDGKADRSSASEVFSSIRGGNGTVSSATDSNAYTFYTGASSVSNQYAYMSRAFFLFDTSALTSNATISSATFSAYVTAKSDGLTTSVSLTNATIAANNALANSDYEGTVAATTKQASDIAISSVSTSAYLDFALNAAGLSGISKTGITKYGGRNTTDVDNSAPTWVNGVFSGLQVNFSDNGSNIPKLVIDFTVSTTGAAFFFLNFV